MDLEKLFAYTTATNHKTRKTYHVIGTARLMASRALYDRDPVVIFRRTDGELLARDEPEFNDGRYQIQTHKLPEGMGFDPLKTDRDEKAAWERLRYAYACQQHFVPDQMALVWRVDLGMFRHELIRLRALADINKVEIAKLKSELATVTHKNKTAIDALQGLLNLNVIPVCTELAYAERIVST